MATMRPTHTDPLCGCYIDATHSCGPGYCRDCDREGDCQAGGSIEGIAIYPDKRIVTVTLDGLEDYQAIVKGYIEPVNLSFGTMYVNEEFLLGQFGPEDVNWIACDVAGLGGRPEFMFNPILGPVVLVGGVDDEGYDLGLTERGRDAVNRVGREAGGRFEQLKGESL